MDARAVVTNCRARSFGIIFSSAYYPVDLISCGSPLEGADLLAARPFGGAKHRRDEAAFAVEYDDRLKTIFVVMRIEEPQLLAAMNRIECVVDVERDPPRDLPEGFAIKIDHGAAHAQQGARVGQVQWSRFCAGRWNSDR